MISFESPAFDQAESHVFMRCLPEVYMLAFDISSNHQDAYLKEESGTTFATQSKWKGNYNCFIVWQGSPSCLHDPKCTIQCWCFHFIFLKGRQKCAKDNSSPTALKIC